MGPVAGFPGLQVAQVGEVEAAHLVVNELPHVPRKIVVSATDRSSKHLFTSMP